MKKLNIFLLLFLGLSFTALSQTKQGKTTTTTTTTKKKSDKKPVKKVPARKTVTKDPPTTHKNPVK